jgi:hypothetical protein
MDDREVTEVKWKRNEAELNRLHSLSPGARAEFGDRIDQLEAEQDAIEWEVGREDIPPGSKRWSGLP